MSDFSADIHAFRNRLASQQLEPYRFLDGSEVSWQSSPAGTDRSLQRFLIARKGDVERAEQMFADSLRWRRRVFPIEREGAVAAILDDGRRFSNIGLNADGMQVLMVDFLWGYFNDGFSSLDCLRASLYFIESEITEAEKLGISQAYIICYGGPPPLDYAAALAATLEANYPERLARAVIYPPPRVVAKLVRMMLWFLDKDTNAKVKIEWDEAGLLQLMAIELPQLPAFMRGGLRAAELQHRPDSKTRMSRLVRDGLYGGTGAARELQKKLLNTTPRRMVQAASSPTFQWDSMFSCCVSREEKHCRSAPQTYLEPVVRREIATPHELKEDKSLSTWASLLMLLFSIVAMLCSSAWSPYLLPEQSLFAILPSAT
eukprot:TRINITY_DN55269_c0_g1_i1.p1 TRINITY_DN55269_c0_g1~~TRINITY_DN55269_c0_g1_i1.p1  ORF type:complete len:396 (+),score=56.36 TRINITY_DN55269_c0_g1_i1:71-1189(+)